MKNTVNGQTISLVDGIEPLYFPVRTEAEKPISPAVGWRCSVAETGKEYVCFVANVWSLVNSPCYEEYSNHLGTVDNIMQLVLTGTGTGTTDNTNHKMSLSSGTNGTASYKGKPVIDPSSENYEVNILIQDISFSASSVMYIGLMDSIALYNGVYFYIDKNIDPSWGCVKSDTVSVHISSAGSISSGDLLTFIGKGQQTIFMVNGNIVATIDYNIESLSCYPFIAVSDGSGPSTISIDYISWRNYK